MRLLCATFAFLLLAVGAATAEITKQTDGTFTIEHSVALPVSPEEAYDAMTGDISGWWDHKFSEAPARFFIEARPGGGFLEIFDDSGDGVLHATVIYAQRGKKLTFEGPLGFNGKALTLVMTYAYEPTDNGCVVQFTAHGSGQIEEGWAQAIDGVWHHFLVEQLKPYIEAGKHKS